MFSDTRVSVIMDISVLGNSSGLVGDVQEEGSNESNYRQYAFSLADIRHYTRS